MRNNKTLFLFIFSSELIKKEPTTEAEEKAVLRNIFGDLKWEAPEILEKMNEVEDIYFDRVSQIQMKHWAKGRVALIGDAVACVSLLAGEGTGLAMTEAYILAGELHKAQGDYKTAFSNYQSILQDFLKKKQKSASDFAGFFAPKNGFMLFLNNLGIKLSNHSFFAKLFIGKSLRDDVELPVYG